MTLEGGARPQGCLAESKKPEHCQDYDDQTNNVYESIHDLTCEYIWPEKAAPAGAVKWKDKAVICRVPSFP
jgi:hypothetical protein